MAQPGDSCSSAAALAAIDSHTAEVFRSDVVERTPEPLARELGPGFASAVFALAPGAWHGPGVDRDCGNTRR